MKTKTRISQRFDILRYFLYAFYVREATQLEAKFERKVSGFVFAVVPPYSLRSLEASVLLQGEPEDYAVVTKSNSELGAY